MRAIKDIETKINQLTPGLIGELDHYLDYLINKSIAKKPKKLKQENFIDATVHENEHSLTAVT